MTKRASGASSGICAPGLLCRVASKRSYLRSRLFFQNRLRTRMTQSWNFSPVAHIALKKANGAPDTIRTCDLCLRRAKLTAQMSTISECRSRGSRAPATTGHEFLRQTTVLCDGVP